MPKDDSLKKEISLLRKENHNIRNRLTNIEQILNIGSTSTKTVNHDIKSSSKTVTQDSSVAKLTVGITLLIIGIIFYLIGFVTHGFLGFLGFILFIIGIVMIIKNKSVKTVETKKVHDNNQVQIKTKSETQITLARSPAFSVKKEIKQKEQKMVPKQKSSSFEADIGIKWFSGIGIAALVIGIGLFIKYAIDNNWINHLSRIILGVLVGITLIVIGEITAKKEKYMRWAKTLTGGGFAIAYFAVYASYYFSDYRQAIGSNQTLTIILLCIVAIASIIFALKDDSQIIAIESFLLGYVTSLLSNNIETISVVYNVLLVTSLIVICIYKKWNGIVLGSVIASYLLFMFTRSQGHLSFGYALFILIFYFVAFSVQTFFGDHKKNLPILIFNSLAFFILAYRLLEPEHKTYLGLGTLIFALYYLVTYYYFEKQKNLITATSSLYLGLFYLILVIPIQLNSEWIAIAWSLEALLFTLLYLKSKINAFQIGAGVVAGIATVKILNMSLLFYTSWTANTPSVRGTRMITFLFAILSFYSIYYLLQQSTLENSIKRLATGFSWVATGLLVLWIFIEMDKYPVGITIALSLLAITNLYLASALRKELYYQSYSIYSLLVCKVVLYDLWRLDEFNHSNVLASTRLIAMVFAILALYIGYFKLKDVNHSKESKSFVIPLDLISVYSWVALGLFVALIFAEMSAVWITIVFSLLAVITLFIASPDKKDFYYQSYAVYILLVGKMIFYDIWQLHAFNSFNIVGSTRLIAALFAITTLYVGYLKLKEISVHHKEYVISPQLFSWSGFSLALIIIWAELYKHTEWITLLYIILAVILTLLSLKKENECMQQSLLLSIIIVFKILLFDASALSNKYVSSISIRGIVFIAGVIALYSIGYLIEKKKQHVIEYEKQASVLYYYAGTLLLFILIILELKEIWISIGWSIIALIIISFGFYLDNKHFRIQGIIIFAITILKVFIYDTRSLMIVYRTLSYIVLGILLLVVSFIYTKFKDKIKHIV